MAHRSYSDVNAAPYGASTTARSLRWIRRTTAVSVALLAAIAAVVSYQHMHTLVLSHGETRWAAVLIPFSVDGMVVASSMSILMASRLGRRGEWLPWALLIVGSLASLAANVLVAEPSVVGRVIAAWPSFAFVGAYHMLQGQLPLLQDGTVDQRTDHGDVEFGALELPDVIDDSLLAVAEPGGHLQRRAWEWAQANRLENGELPAGAVIAQRFNRSPRWGRLVKKAGIAGSLD